MEMFGFTLFIRLYKNGGNYTGISILREGSCIYDASLKYKDRRCMMRDIIPIIKNESFKITEKYV